MPVIPRGNMRSLSMSMLLLMGVVTAFQDTASLFKDSFHVHTLHNGNFDQMLARSDEVWIVDFYAPWCPHCRDFAPELEKIGAHYAPSKLVHVAAVDCTKNDAVCTQQDIMAYPAVKVFHIPPTSNVGTKFTQFGRKTRQVIVDWVEDLLDEAEMKSGVARMKPEEDIAVEGSQEQAKETVETKEEAKQASTIEEEPEDSLRLHYARLQDAGAAALYTLETSLFAGSSVLEGDRYMAAVQWLEALTATFPIAANRKVFEELLTTLKTREQWEFTEWKSLMTEWKKDAALKTFPKALLVQREDDGDENRKWVHCTTYTCGLWTLIHTMTVEAGTEHCTMKPSEVGAAIRLYLLNFFGCQECAMHFARANPISVIDELAKSDHVGNTALVVWMWRMHNIVNKVTKKQFWPSLRACPSCFAEGVETPSMNPATLRPKEIAAFISKAYQQRESDLWSMTGTGKGVVASMMDSMNGFYGVILVALLVVIIVVFGCQDRGSHKGEHTA